MTLLNDSTQRSLAFALAAAAVVLAVLFHTTEAL
jgi:hypothetical protein